jgi:putative colanic acid biosynthesis UDP-glucose lipid carrier transferase
MAAFVVLILERLMLRFALRVLRSRGRNTRTVAVAGASAVAQEIIARVLGAPWMGLRLVGVYDDRQIERLHPMNGRPFDLAGKLSDLVRDTRYGEIDYVYVAVPMRSEERVMKLVNALADTTASVYVVPDLFVTDLMNARWVSVEGMPMVSVV